MKKSDNSPARGEPRRPHLPDPATLGPYRPFASDPGWSEAWWWLGVPIFIAIFVIVSYRVSPEFYMDWVLPEGYGVLEMTQFLTALAALAIAVRLLFDPFVRARPLTFAVAIIGALTCFYIAGEEMSWGQHFFHWNTPEYWAEVNRQKETNLHNTYAIFEKFPRAVLEIGIVIGGLLTPIAARFVPWLRACRLSLFFPPEALVPSALGMLAFKASDIVLRHHGGQLIPRPSETVENYLYFFLLAYLIVYTRRIRELEHEAGVKR